MPFVPAPNIMMVEFRYNQSGQKTENRIMLNRQAPVTEADLQAAAILCWNWWQLDYSAHVTLNVELREVVATDLTTQNGPQTTYAPSIGVVGDKPAPLPNEAAFCISLRSASRGRSARGRWYVAGLSGNDRSDPNTLTSIYTNDLTSSVQGLITQLAAAGTPWTVVSYRSNNAPRPGGPVYFEVENALAVDSVIDSQKRRKPGVGS